MDLTDWNNDYEDDHVFQHDCLHIPASIDEINDSQQIISYCLTESLSKWNIQSNSLYQKYTFIELYQLNITSYQLYLWSAPIDLIERYQLYLNHLSISMELQIFYNCTLPRFGPFCQYSLDIYNSNLSSLNNIIYNFFQQEYNPNNLTCYLHLECNRGSTKACLDWSEICDGIIDCLNDGIDEKYCWELEINECKENEYRCDNGQCISKIFFHDDLTTYECLDRSDEIRDVITPFQPSINEPIFSYEDIICPLRSYFYTTKFTSSCIAKRDILLTDILFIDTPKLLTDICWLAFKYNYGIPNILDIKCTQLNFNKTCKQIINETCPEFFIIPAGALTFGHIYFAYVKKILMNTTSIIDPQYICYNNQLCNGFSSNKTLLIFNNLTCRRPEDFPISLRLGGRYSLISMYIKSLYTYLYQCNTIIYDNINLCNSSTMYQCINSSKCISKYNLCDGKYDCDYKDDENCFLINNNCSLKIESNFLFKCKINQKYISLKMINNGYCDCGYDIYGICDDEYSEKNYIRKQISFTTICDGFTELIPIMINGKNHTDETDCDYWLCNNTYTRCDGIWNCFNGADEIDCNPSSSSLINCPLYHHICVSPNTYQLICLPLEKANDGIIDCLGGTDEPQLCRSIDQNLNNLNFYCRNDSIHKCISMTNVCYGKQICAYGDDRLICNQNRNNTLTYNACNNNNALIRTDSETFFCQRLNDMNKQLIVYFSLNKTTTTTSISNEIILQSKKKRSIEDQNTIIYDQRCHRGLPIRIWTNNNNNNQNLMNIACLCPPSFYGDHCQYQNQRVSLTLQFQTYSNSRTILFALVILLIDNSYQRMIHSYKQLTYIYTKHCQTKFNIYLLYSNRPKILQKNYSIHIDIYEKISFIYRGSLLIPLNYSFLPVHRIAIQLNIPRSIDRTSICSNQICIHGQCIIYSEDPNKTSFCHCDIGWSGKNCSISYKCQCSSDSLCIGLSSNNRSICICPLNKWGSRCFLQTKNCQYNSTCKNGGQCVTIDEYSVSEKQSICICLKGFSGKYCEISDNILKISFDKNIILSNSILIHFIRIINNNQPENGSTYKTISINQNSFTIQWSNPFHIAFIEIFYKKFYLITVQQNYKQSITIIKTINSLDQCLYINEILNQTIINLHLIHRIKYYHLPCQNQSLLLLLSCFYDENYFCLCQNFGQQRLANCFEFNSSIKHNCFGQSNCENGAQCLQDRLICPQTTICVCPICFYGTICQFSSNLFSLSLDGIIGYHIQPNINILNQSKIIQISIIITILMFIIGLINSILTLIVLKNIEIRKSGSNIYLIASTISTLFTMIIFLLKFFILLFVQILNIKNRLFLLIQCISIDYLLYISLNLNQWINSCISMERAITVVKGINFNKEKSKQISKYIIIILIIFNIIIFIYDPINRRLINDDNNENDKRIWCIISYSFNIKIFNLINNIFHFSIPFLINIISSFIIINKIAQKRTHIYINQTFQQLLYKQFYKHNHMFLTPILLIIFAIPKLILLLTLNCMKSNNDSWLFLIGYFITFIPSTMTFIIFILPSKLYKNEFYKIIQRYKRQIQSRIYPMT